MTFQKTSYFVGTSQPPLLEQTIGEALEAAVKRWPQAEALVSRHQGLRYTWAELKSASDSFAAGLLRLGISPGDRVGMWSPNCAEWAIAQFATARIGAILVNINPAYRTSELEYTIRNVGIRALICAVAFKTSDYVAMAEAVALSPGTLTGSGNKQPLALDHLIKIGGKRRAGWLDFDEVAAGHSDASQIEVDKIAATLKPLDPINIQFTSGTTGSPKGATLSHSSILNNAYFAGLRMGLRAGDRLCIPVPLYHCFGMVLGNLACLIHGGTMVYPAAAFEPLSVLETVESERCNVLHGVPTMFIAELEHPAFDRFDLSSLRTGLMGGSPCPVEIMHKVLTRMHMRDVGIVYGMTETSPVSFQTAPEDSIERRVATIGRVLPHVEVKIVDPSTGVTLPHGQAGELCTRGYLVMLGYWGDTEKTSEVVRDGWMHTGDLATIDEEGYACVVGRIKDIIIRGGENIYPREIEEFIFTHPAIEDVQVIGVPSAKFGEEVTACVKLRAGASVSAEEIIAYCRSNIAHYKIPKHVCFLDTFPMTVSGKVQKFQLRDIIVAELQNA